MTLPSVDPGHQVIIFIRSWLARLPFLLSHLWPLGRTWPWGDPNMEHLLEDMWELEWSPAVASGDIIDFIYSDQICARRVPGRLDGHPNVATWSKIGDHWSRTVLSIRHIHHRNMTFRPLK